MGRWLFQSRATVRSVGVRFQRRFANQSLLGARLADLGMKIFAPGKTHSNEAKYSESHVCRFSTHFRIHLLGM